MPVASSGDPQVSRGPDFGRTGVLVFVVALAMAFACGIALFVIARTGAGGHVVRDTLGNQRPMLPLWLWFSTFFLFASSVALHQSLQGLKASLAAPARRSFLLATGLAWIFAVLQVPGLWRLAARFRADSGERSIVYFLVLFLVGLHLVHAAGGLAPMTALARRARFEGDPSESRHLGSFAIYWHFLGAVWLALFATFTFVR